MSEDVGGTPVNTAPQRKSWHWMSAGWLTVVIGVVVWVLMVVGFSVAWQGDRLPTTPLDESWSVDVMTFTVGEMHTGAPLVTPWGERVDPQPRASWVIVSVDYSTRDPEVEYSCYLELVGKDRTWNPTYDSRLDLSRFFDSYHSNCDTNDFGMLTTSGTIAGLFEIPLDAVDELQAVRLTLIARTELSWTLDDAWDTELIRMNFALQ
ncbi:MAG: hypothetical protein FWG15_03270 [Propionibacteriaceae bacterium]|nr:hypothetical protein [Propionibacteriaceae bacterium]